MTHPSSSGAPTFRQWLDDRTAAERETLARLWRVPPEHARSPRALADALLQPATVHQVLALLQPPELAALQQVQAEGGVIAGPVLERSYGVVRAIGQYPNPRAYLLALEQPPSPTERLWTLGMLLRTSDQGMDRYVIPNDLLALLPPVPLRATRLVLPTAALPPTVEQPGTYEHWERMLLLLLTLAHDGKLAVVPRGGLNKASMLQVAKLFGSTATLGGVTREEHWPYVRFMRLVAEGAGLLATSMAGQLRTTRAALEWMALPQIERARQVLHGWAASGWDELASLNGMRFQHAYGRNLQAAKRAMLRLVAQLPPAQWVALDAFVAAVHEADPDFARPDGRYDTWGISSHTRQPLDGWQHWQAVEGAQLRGALESSLHWLGVLDLGLAGDAAHSVRLSATGAALLQGAPPPDEPRETLRVQPNFEVLVPRHAPLQARFQIGRIAERASAPGDAMQRYQLTKRRTVAALEREIGVEDVLRFLHDASEQPVPQNVAATLREWANQHGQLSLRRATLLQARDAVLLHQIKRDKRVKLGAVEPLAETAWLVRDGDAPALAERLRKAGYGLADDLQGEQTVVREQDLAVLFAALDFYARACGELGIPSSASSAMQQRIAALLPETQINRAYQTSRAALQRLKEEVQKKNDT